MQYEFWILGGFRYGSFDSCIAKETFDFIVCRTAFKNFSEPRRALEEMYRVLKPGGRALIIDLRSDASRESINDAVDGMGLSAANRVITKLTFRFMLLKRSYSRMGFEELVAQTEFHGAEIREDLIGLEVLVSKERPRFLIW